MRYAQLPTPPLASCSAIDAHRARDGRLSGGGALDGLGLALALVSSDMERRAERAEAVAKHERLRAETVERRARQQARAARAREEEERAAAEVSATRRAHEERRNASLRAAREHGRQRMKLRVSERNQAKAAALVQTLRREVRTEQRRLRAVLCVQACARRWLARCAVQRARGWRIQRQICAQQAAWRAKSLALDRGKTTLDRGKTTLDRGETATPSQCVELEAAAFTTEAPGELEERVEAAAFATEPEEVSGELEQKFSLFRGEIR
jgi:hypothetical protein